MEIRAVQYMGGPMMALHRREKEKYMYHVINLETQKLELHFDKTEYDALEDAQKQSIKSNFLWSRGAGAWVSRAKQPNLWRAKQVAEKLGSEDRGKEGERLSFAEQQERKAERAEARADRYEQYAQSAAEKAVQLQKPIDDMHGDVAFFTQPNVDSSAGRAFTNRRNKMFSAFEKGFDEYRKSDYYKDRAKTARETAQGTKPTDKGFICRRIKETEASIRSMIKNMGQYEGMLDRIDAGETVKSWNNEDIPREKVAQWLENTMDQADAYLDKLAYYQDCLEAVGGVTFSKDNVAKGDFVKLPHYGRCEVVGCGKVNVTVLVMGMKIKFAYAEIQQVIKKNEAGTEDEKEERAE